MNNKMKRTLRASVEDNSGKVDRFLEESTELDWVRWKYHIAIPTLKPSGELIKFYINGVEVWGDDGR